MNKILQTLREKARQSWLRDDPFRLGYEQALRDIEAISHEADSHQSIEQEIRAAGICQICARHGCDTCHDPEDRCPCARDGRT